MVVLLWVWFHFERCVYGSNRWGIRDIITVFDKSLDNPNESHKSEEEMNSYRNYEMVRLHYE